MLATKFFNGKKMFVPLKIKLKKQKYLEIHWNDGKVFQYPLKFLRDESPDAGNKGETVLWRHFDPVDQKSDTPGKYEIANIEQVGNYAINIFWNDGDANGIYSWELLRKLGEYLEVKSNLHQDFEHHHNEENQE